MSVRRNYRGKWIVDIVYTHSDGKVERIEKTSPVQSRRGAESYERQVRRALLDGSFNKKEVPTFEDWYNGRYWQEWVEANKNKPSTQEAKRSIYEHHLKDAFGKLRLDEIGPAQIARFRARLVKAKLTDKSRNNILTALSKPLRFAEDVGVIPLAPRVKLFKIERPEIEWWEFEQYARILEAARREGPVCYGAVCLAGEAGLRVGEVKGLRWREDVDLVAGTITVNRQIRRGVEGTPKGRTRRTVPMTSTLASALRGLDVVREGSVIRALPGHAKTNENQLKNLMYRVCRLAGLPERGWHCLRHSFGTHAAALGVNPWKLMTWMGHKRIDETMRYVHVAEAHRRGLPPAMLKAGEGELDPDQRVLAMLGARLLALPREHDANAHQQIAKWA